MTRSCRLFLAFSWFVPALLLGVMFSLTFESSTSAAESTAKTPGDASEKTDEDKAQLEQDEEYFELLRLFADAFDQIERNYVKEVSRRELMEAAVRGALSKLDPYSSYISPEDLERFRSGVESEFGGIGIQVTIEDGHLKIISPLVGSPAYRAGLMAGDRIIKIEGKGTKGITLDEAILQLKGKVGTKVNFTVLHPHDGTTETVQLEREIVKVQTVLGERRQDDDAWDFMLDSEKKIGYVRVSAFSRNTVEELKQALDNLKSRGMKGLVLDLRYNPGGLLSAAIAASDLFVSEGRIVSTKGRNTVDRAWDAQKADTFEGFPMAVLVNRYSASASEIVAACLQDHKRAVVVGERTWGKGSVQNIIELEEGRSALKLTTAGYQRPSGKNIHRFPGSEDGDQWGVTPDNGYRLKLTQEQTEKLVEHQRRVLIVKPKVNGNGAETDTPESEYVDPQLEKALGYLDGQLAKKQDQDVAEEEADKPEGQAADRPVEERLNFRAA